MKRLFFAGLFVLGLLSLSTQAQDQDPVLMTIDGKEIKLSEFTRILNKNTQTQNQEDLKESLDLFINFKLKVTEAEALGYDTSKQFIDELKRNRDQIAKPYLLDQSVNEQLLEEAYLRSLEEVRSRHILVGVTPDAAPSDTLRAYQKAMKIKHRLLAGEDFETVAKELSEDPSAMTNGGDLGYYTVLLLVYPFENAIYNTPVGEITDPVRTQFGYHIIQVTDRRPARGQLQVAVILKQVNFAMTEEEAAEVKTEIFRIDSLIKAGEDFAELAKKYSDDRTTGNRGGLTRWFGVGSFPPEFEDAAFGLENVGDVSEPLETQMGWYLIQLKGKKDNPPKEEVLPTLARRVSRDARSAKSRKEIVRKLKGEYNFKVFQENLEEFYRLVDPSIFDERWDPVMALQKTAPLFTIGERAVLQRDFAQYLALNMKQGTATTIAEYVDHQFNNFVEMQVLQYEDSQLERKYPEFKALYQEFREGNLLFEITDNMVWSKAAQDSAGLAAYFESNSQNYLWDERVDGFIISIKSMENLEQFRKEVEKFIQKNSKKTLSAAELESEIGLLADRTKGDSFEIIEGPFAKGNNRLIDSIKWKKGALNVSTEGETVHFAWITNLREKEPKELSQCKGQVLADYQDYLEKEWVKSLKEKYSVVVKEDVLDQIK